MRATGLANGRLCAVSLHTTSNKSQQELVELFIDDKPVQVPPGTTVLQVCVDIIFAFSFLIHFQFSSLISLPGTI